MNAAPAPTAPPSADANTSGGASRKKHSASTTSWLQQFQNSWLYQGISTGVYRINHHVMYLNNSKLFAGVILILMNIGTKFIPVQFSRSTEEYMKYSITKQILVFAMAWMGTRDIYTAIGLTIIFTILSDFCFNEESAFCIVPHHYRVLHKLVDTNNDGEVSEMELQNARLILEKAKREHERKQQQQAFSSFQFQQFAQGP